MLKIVLSSMVIALASVSMADVYKVDTQASKVAWKGTKKMGSAHNGQVSIKDGQITTDKKNNLTAGHITIDMTTISNEDLKDSPEYQKKLVGHLSNADFFDTEKYPTSTFKFTSVKPGKGKNEYNVEGDLTMIGKTNSVKFPATVTVENGVLTGQGVIKIDRTKWGLKYGSGDFFKELAGDKIINNEFELDVKIVAKK